MTARIVVDGNAATSPVVRVTKTGRRVANFRIGSTERRQDRESGDWMDGNSFFVSVACWGALADNVERSVKVGTPLVVTGKISLRTYTDADDKVQNSYEIMADSVAPDLNRGVADFTRVSRTSGPPVAVDERGDTVVGVAEDPWERTGAARGQGSDESSYAVRDDGHFDLLDLSTPHAGDDAEGYPEGERDPALVGSAP
jgi:single stranded DNA-binding protein